MHVHGGAYAELGAPAGFDVFKDARTCAGHQNRVLAAARTASQQAVQQVTKRTWLRRATRTCNRRSRAILPSFEVPAWKAPDWTLWRVLWHRSRTSAGRRGAVNSLAHRLVMRDAWDVHAGEWISWARAGSRQILALSP
jgi:hypothetical protein